MIPATTARAAHEVNRHLPRRADNTVFGVPERTFRERWISTLWQAMAKTGRGYRRPSAAAMRGDERRKDKPGTSKLSRRLARSSTPDLRAGRFPSMT
jgi:hypothetical protein